MKDTLEFVFILDQSGSMSGLEEDTIGGFNSILEKQRDNKENDVVVSVVLFNNKTDVIYNRVPIEDVKPLSKSQYVVGGSTALLDAVGGAIDHIVRVHLLLGKKDQPSKTMFVITTDGQENSSRRFSKHTIHRMVSEKQEDGWEFMFLGANIDAYKSAKEYGFRSERVSNYMHDGEGVRNLYESLNVAVSDLRTSKKIRDSWKQDVESDYAKRSGKYGSK